MPYHPGHHRAAPWQLAIAALVIGLLILLYVWSFRGGDDAALDAPAPAVPGGPVIPPAGSPAPPGAGGGERRE